MPNNPNPPASWYEPPEDPREGAHEYWTENVAPDNIAEIDDLTAWDMFEAWWAAEDEAAMDRAYQGRER